MTNEIFEAEEVVTLDTIMAESNDACSGCKGCSEEETIR